MSIEVTCRCGRVLRAKDDLAGKRVRCPQCQQPVLVEAAPEVLDDVDVVDTEDSPSIVATGWETSDWAALPDTGSPALNPLYPDLGTPAAFSGQPMMGTMGAYHQPPRSRVTEQTVRTVAYVGGGITALILVGFIAAVLLRPGVEVPIDSPIASGPRPPAGQQAEIPQPAPIQSDELSSPTDTSETVGPGPIKSQDLAADTAPAAGQTVEPAPVGETSPAKSVGKWEDLGLVLHKRQEETATLRGATKIDDDPVMAGFSWMTELLPHLGHGSIYEQLDLSKSWSDKRNLELTQSIIPEFLNPADPRKQWSGYPFQGMALTHFVGVSGIEEARNDVAATLPRSDPRAGVFGYDEIAGADEITDGTSQTVMIIGSGELASPWVQGGGATIRGAREPYFGPISGFGSRGLKEAGAQAVFADGSVRTLSKQISPKVFRALVTIHGAETIDQEHLAAGSAILNIKGQADDDASQGRVEWQEQKSETP